MTARITEPSVTDSSMAIISFNEAYFQTLLYTPNNQNMGIFTRITIKIYQPIKSEYWEKRPWLSIRPIWPLKKKEITNDVKIIKASNISCPDILNAVLLR